MPFVVLVIVALIGAAVQLFVQKRPRTRERVLDVLLVWLLGVGIGVIGIFAWSGHIFRAEQIAESIGFPPGNPFQWEVAWANAAVGALGLICFWRRDFWWPTAIAAAIYLWGCAWGHIYEYVEHDNRSPNNVGPVLWMDIAIPLVILILLVIRHRLREADERGAMLAAPAAGD
jgi:uncharacterized membrane protein YphA (DoxX/SURF4 family)